MKRIILWVLPFIPILFWLFRFFPAPFFFFAVGFLATAVYFVDRVVRPWLKERTTKKPGPPYRFYGYLSLISFLSLIAAWALFIIFSIQPVPPAPLQGHTNQVNIMAFNSVADRLASGGVDGSIRLWNVPQNSFIRSLPDKDETLYAKYGDLYTSLAYSPDGNLIAFGSTDQTIRVWDMKKNVLLYQLAGHVGPVNVLAFSPDGKLLASGGQDKIVRIWRVGDGSLAGKLEEKHTQGVTSLAFNSAGDYLASGSSDNTACLWRVSDGAFLIKFEGLSEPVIGVAFGRDPTFIKDKETVLAVSAKGTLRRWPVDDPKNYREMFKERAADITAVAFSRDGFYMATADFDKRIQIWLTLPVPSNLPTPKVTPNIPVTPTPPHAPIGTLNRQNEIITSLAFDPVGKLLASTGKDNRIRIWKVPEGQLLKEFDQGIEVKAIAFSPDGNSIASASIDKTVRVLEKNEGKELARYEGFSRDIRQLAFSQDGANLVSVSRDGYIRSWRIKDSALLHERKAEPNQITSLAIQPTDGNVLATGLVTGTFQIWRLDGGEPSAIQAHNRPVSSLAYTPNGSLIASASIDEPIRIWTAEGKPVNSVSGQKGEITTLVFSPDSRTLASASSDKTLVLTPFADTTGITTTKPITISGLPVAATTMAFSQDGTILATGGGDNVIRLWRAADGTAIDDLSGFEQPVRNLGITKDNAIVATANVPAGSDIRSWTVGDLKSIRDPFSTNSLRRWIFGSEAARIFWAYVFGLALAAAIILVPIYGYSQIVARVFMAQYPEFTASEARRLAVDTQLGTYNVMQTVVDGKLRTIRPASPLARVGGPGNLIVEEGNVVVLVRGGKLSRIVARGITSLEPFESVSLAVYLGTTTLPCQIKDVVTKDKIAINSFIMQLDYKINPGDKSKSSGIFPYDDNVITNIWTRKASHRNERKTEDQSGIQETTNKGPLLKDERTVSWDEPLGHVIYSAVRDVVAGHDLEELMLLHKEARLLVNDQIIKQINTMAKPFIGLEIEAMAVDVQHITIPEAAMDKMWDRWLTNMDKEITKAKSEIAKMRLESQGEGQALALAQVEKIKNKFREDIIKQVSDLLSKGDKPPISDSVVAVRLLQMIEELTKSIVRDDVGSVRYLEALEEFAKAKGDKTIYLGQDVWPSAQEISRPDKPSS